MYKMFNSKSSKSITRLEKRQLVDYDGKIKINIGEARFLAKISSSKKINVTKKENDAREITRKRIIIEEKVISCRFLLRIIAIVNNKQRTIEIKIDIQIKSFY
jgi:hypothetical protein